MRHTEMKYSFFPLRD